jgi:hypothetical protein
MRLCNFRGPASTVATSASTGHIYRKICIIIPRTSLLCVHEDQTAYSYAPAFARLSAELPTLAKALAKPSPRHLRLFLPLKSASVVSASVYCVCVPRAVGDLWMSFFKSQNDKFSESLPYYILYIVYNQKCCNNQIQSTCCSVIPSCRPDP